MLTYIFYKSQKTIFDTQVNDLDAQPSSEEIMDDSEDVDLSNLTAVT